MTTFAPEVVTAVCAHMNADHTEDSLRIVRAFAHPEATAAVMSGLDHEAGVWTAMVAGSEQQVRIPWPGAPISERAEIRRDVVVLYEQACERLGLEPEGH